MGNEDQDEEDKRLRLVNELLAQHEDEQRARARRVLDAYFAFPVVPDADSAADSELAEFDSYAKRLFEWVQALRSIISANLDHESMWAFVELATAEESKAALARFKEAELERVRRGVAPAAESRRLMGLSSDQKLEQAVRAEYVGTRLTRKNVAARLAGRGFGSEETIRQKLGRLFPKASWPPIKKV